MAKNIDIGVGGVSRVAKAGYVGVAGVARQFAEETKQLKYVGNLKGFSIQWNGANHVQYAYSLNLGLTPGKTYLLCDSNDVPVGTIFDNGRATGIAACRPAVLDATTKIYEINI